VSNSGRDPSAPLPTWFIAVTLLVVAYVVVALFVLGTYSLTLGLVLFAPLVVAGAVLYMRIPRHERAQIAAAYRAGSAPAS
jgi:hypothetical protein